MDGLGLGDRSHNQSGAGHRLVFPVFARIPTISVPTNFTLSGVANTHHPSPEPRMAKHHDSERTKTQLIGFCPGCVRTRAKCSRNKVATKTEANLIDAVP